MIFSLTAVADLPTVQVCDTPLLIVIGMTMIQTNFPIPFSQAEILFICSSSCYGFIIMVDRVFNLKDTFGTAVKSNNTIWRCSHKWPLRINEQSTFCYLQIIMLQPNRFFIPFLGLFFMPATQFVCLDVKLKASG